MEKLVSIIGPAPHEMPFQDLLTKLDKERSRVAAFLEKNGPKLRKARSTSKRTSPRARASKKLKQDAALSAVAKAMGMSLEEFKEKGGIK